MSFGVYPYLPNMTTTLYSFYWLYLMCSLGCQHSKTQYNIHISNSLTHIGRILYIKTGPSLLCWPNCLATKARYVSDIFHINLLIHIGLHITELQIVDFASIVKINCFPNINFWGSIHSLKDHGGATKQDMLLLTTLWYSSPSTYTIIVSSKNLV